MTIGLYLDEDAMSRGLVAALRSRGIDVMAASDAGMVQRPDEEHLAYASSQGRALFSYNMRHYMAIHTKFLNQGKTHQGLILAEQHYSVGELMRRLSRIVAALSVDEMRDQVVFLSAWGER